MTVTRHSLIKCRTKDCPFTPDEHDEWMELCSKAPEHGHRHDQLTHQHIPKIGMGGNNPLSKIVSIICWPMHDRIDNGDFRNDVKDMPGRGEVYFAQDLHGNTLIERDLSDGTGRDNRPVGYSTKEESDGGHDLPESEGEAAAVSREKAPQVEPRNEGDKHVLRGGDDGGGSLVQKVLPNPDLLRDNVLTHEQRVAIAQDIHDTEWGRQWVAGDTANAWEAEMGQDAWQYLSDFGYQPESLSNVMNVCAAVPKRLRGYNLRFSHFVVVAGENLEDMEMHLAECEEEQWSVAEFRRRRKGTKPRVKRWSADELWEKAKEWNDDDPHGAFAFIQWLREQA